MSPRSRPLARGAHLIAAAAIGLYVYAPRLQSRRYGVVLRAALLPSLLLTGAIMWQGPRFARRLRRIRRMQGERGPGTGRADAGDLVIHGHTHGLIDPTIKRSRAGLRATALALLVLGITAAVQALIFAASGSIALLADLVHNFGDAATAIPVGAAFALRSLRAERVAGLAVIVAIFVSACVAAYEAIDRLFHPREVEAVAALAAAGLIGFVGNWWAAHIRTKAGQRLRSPALVADGNHARTDAYVSLGVVASAVAVAFGVQAADPLIGLAITAVILHITRQSWQTIRILSGGVS